MKNLVSIAVGCLFLVLLSLPSFAQKVGPVEVLQKVSRKLADLKTVSYTFRRELNYETSGFLNQMQIECFLDLSSPDRLIGTKFQFDEPNFTFVFNGSEYFALNKKNKTFVVKSKPAFTDFDSLPGFYDSLLTLKNSLAGIISDKSIPKTVVANASNKDVYVIEIILDSKIMTLDGKYFTTTPRKFTYRLTVDRSTFLPLDLLRSNSVNKDFSRTSFEYKKDPVMPAENSWYYSSYKNEYKPQAPVEDRLIKAGQIAPEWKLTSITDNSQISLSQYKNKVVMLEFWISFCGYCIAAVPRLNILAEKYRGKDFALIGINASDSKDIIEKFARNNRPKYLLLHGGEEIAKNYGINGFPMIVLLDRSGKVVYSGDFDPVDTKTLEALIDKAIGIPK